MFGRRPDGRSVGKNVDPFTRMMPYIMTERSDAQVASVQYVESEVMSGYIRKKRGEGLRISHMELVIAAFVRVVSQMPQINRFIVGRKLYARKELTVSFVILRERSRRHVSETTVKIRFDPSDTIFDVAKRVGGAVAGSRSAESGNSADRLVNLLLSVPGLVFVSAGLIKLLDRCGLLPKSIIDVSPFHSSLFLSNMGSLKMGHVYHHIANFGTTSYFFALGKRAVRLGVSSGGKIFARHCYPIGVVNDERVAPGGTQGLATALLTSLLKNPERLESPPEEIFYDMGLEYHEAKPS